MTAIPAPIRSVAVGTTGEGRLCGGSRRRRCQRHRNAGQGFMILTGSLSTEVCHPSRYPPRTRAASRSHGSRRRPSSRRRSRAGTWPWRGQIAVDIAKDPDAHGSFRGFSREQRRDRLTAHLSGLDDAFGSLHAAHGSKMLPVQEFHKRFSQQVPLWLADAKAGVNYRIPSWPEW
jgi:hypothetical protein